MALTMPREFDVIIEKDEEGFFVAFRRSPGSTRRPVPSTS
jgi:predicted RNase H-like HicB family nuclease